MKIDQLRMNFLSRQLFQKSYYNLTKKKINTKLKVLSIIFGISLLIEISCIVANFISYEVALPTSDEIEVFGEAKKKNEEIKKKLFIINQAEKEDKEIIKVIDILSEIRPKDVQFIKLEIDNKGEIKLLCKAKNPNDFNDFVTEIKKNSLFNNAKLENFNTSKEKNTEFKIGNISIVLRKMEGIQ